MNEAVNSLLKSTTMKIRRYNSLSSIRKEAFKINIELYETAISYSFRIFKNKQTTFLHIYYKP